MRNDSWYEWIVVAVFSLLAAIAVMAMMGCGQVGVTNGTGRGDWTSQFEEPGTEYKWSLTIPYERVKTLWNGGDIEGERL